MDDGRRVDHLYQNDRIESSDAFFGRCYQTAGEPTSSDGDSKIFSCVAAKKRLDPFLEYTALCAIQSLELCLGKI